MRWSSRPANTRVGLSGPADELARLRAALPAGQEGVVTTGSLDVCDTAGNCATAGPVAGVRLDTKPPVAACTPPPPGPLAVEATAPCTAADAGSGLRETDEAAFVLSTSVGAGNADPAAETGSNEVCDVTDNCVTVGPFTANVDLTAVTAGPAVAPPRRVTVLAAVRPAGPVPIPYAEPVGPPGSEVSCQPAPGSAAGDGWLLVTCDVRSASGAHTFVGFPLVVKPVPDLAPGGPAVAGGAWRAVGVGFAPGSAVQVQIDGADVAAATAGADGRVSVDVTMPATANAGQHTQVVRGVDAGGNPLLVVSLVAVDALVVGEQPPTSPPLSAPNLPTSGPSVPADPPGEPAVPRFERDAVPTTTTTTTTPTTPTTTTPGGATTTTSTGSPGPSTTNPGDGSGATGAGPGGDPSSTGTATTGSLPLTGFALGGPVALALALLIGGFVLRRMAARHRVADDG